MTWPAIESTPVPRELCVVSETPGIVREIEGQLRQVGRNSIRLIDDARGETVNSIVDILRGEQNSGRGRAATIDLYLCN